MTTDAARALAEDAFAYTPRWPNQEWLDTERYFLLHNPNPHHLHGLVLRPRLAADAEPTIEEIGAWFEARDRRDFTWLVGDSATPADLRRRLAARGAAPDPDEPVYAGMVIDDAPPKVGGIEARPVATFEEYAAARELSWDAVGMDEAQRQGARARLERAWRDYRKLDILVFAAFIDGRAVACGGVSFTKYGGYLAGAGTHPDYRGRGCYRALVRARWDAAAQRGTPLIAASAGHMSKPILERLGFRQVATVDALVQRR
jgi:GNAT superfamily N-acetyltransferase